MKQILERKILLNAPADKVWNMLTDPKETKKYMFNCEVSCDWKPGSQIKWIGNYQGYESGERGEILEVEVNRRLKYTSIDPNFGIELKPENYLHVTYELKEVEGGTELTTTVENFNGDPQRLNHVASAWDGIVIPSMKNIFNN